MAKALKQAAELALFDFDNPNVTLIPKDTKGTPEGARLAAESALHDGAELIIGPLFAHEVSAAAPVARQGGVPMIAFSSDEKVAGNGVYLLSFLAGRDVPRIVSFAMARGKRNFAELIPQSAYGRIAETAFARAVSSGGGQAAVRATFPPNDSTAMLGPVRQVANAIKSGQGIDALFLPAGRDELPELAPLLASEERLQRARAIHRHRAVGLSQYRQRPGACSAAGTRRPTPRAGATSCSVTPRPMAARRRASPASPTTRSASPCRCRPIRRASATRAAQLTRPTGFSGVDGLFRLLSDGTCERGLAILEVREGGPQVIDPAPSSFATASSY